MRLAAARLDRADLAARGRLEALAQLVTSQVR
jgi:hypothetical protein